MGKAMEHLQLGHFNTECDPDKPYDVYFIITKPGNIFCWDQVGWKTALSDDDSAGATDSTIRFDQVSRQPSAPRRHPMHMHAHAHLRKTSPGRLSDLPGE
jgi:hypothetical protein